MLISPSTVEDMLFVSTFTLFQYILILIARSQGVLPGKRGVYHMLRNRIPRIPLIILSLISLEIGQWHDYLEGKGIDG